MKSEKQVSMSGDRLEISATQLEIVLVQREMECRPVFLSTKVSLYGWLDF